jgi:hypothetical protein
MVTSPPDILIVPLCAPVTFLANQPSEEASVSTVNFTGGAAKAVAEVKRAIAAK